MDNIKNWIKEIILGALALFAGLFFYEREKRHEAEAIADNQEVLNKVNQITGEVTKNDSLIAAETEKQKENQKKVEDEKANTNGDADFFNKRNGGN